MPCSKAFYVVQMLSEIVLAQFFFLYFSFFLVVMVS